MQDDTNNPAPTPAVEPTPQPLQPQPQPLPVATPPTSYPPVINPSNLPPSDRDTADGGIAGEGGKKHSGWREFGAFVGILAIAGLLALILIMFVFRSYAVDGPSMETTLQNQDKLIIWKVPRTIARFTGHQYVPNRGD